MRELRKAPSSRERISLYEKERSQKLERKKAASKIQRRHKAKYPEKTKARRMVSNAIRDGKIIPQLCEVCGEKGQAHHDDYSKPFEVRWLCLKHHQKITYGR